MAADDGGVAPDLAPVPDQGDPCAGVDGVNYCGSPSGAPATVVCNNPCPAGEGCIPYATPICWPGQGCISK